MAWIMDTYSMHVGRTVTAVVTGKPLDLGGSRGRPEATGRGCMIVAREALRMLGVEPASARVVIQGFGNVGGMAARLMSRAGYKIVSIIEVDGAVFNANGLDVAALAEHRRQTGSVVGFSAAEAIDPSTAMFLDCDVLMPAARENVVTSENAARIRARILCEGANGPTTPAADRILAANEDLVNQRLEEIMVENFGRVVDYAARHGVDNRIAAYMLALDRVAFAIKLRGIYA
jgi:glutamate dehydrogenase (NAD(P)+)